ncbi:MAG: replicative DNA helicase [Oscillospiraceae bacterium]|jgi:replicative DNA helicase|nr:replicative DNA helicase [Oscillospiraceae bacterium]
MNELFERRAPHDPQAEQAVLGAMLIDSRCIPDVLEKCRDEDFYLEINRDVFATIAHMYAFGLAVDPITVLDQMRVRGVARDNSRNYVLELMRITPTAANVMKYAEILREFSLMRALSQAAQEITEMVSEGASRAETMLEAAERKIYALRQGRTIGGLVRLGNIVQDVYEQIAEISRSGAAIPGLATGLADLDSLILGLNKGDLIIVASRPGMGKTSIALNIASHVAMTSGKTVAIFSLEMAREQLATRLLASASEINGQRLLKGDVKENEWERLADAADSLAATEILIDDNSTLSVAEMNSQCRRLGNLGLVIIDYLQLMQSAGSGRSYSNENRQQAVSDMSRMLKIMAKELSVPVICLSQLSRAPETRSAESKKRRPQLSDLRESGAIEQDADIVIGLYREGYYDEECENPNAAEAIILKNRHGDTGKVDLIWQAEYTRYVPRDTRHHEYDSEDY